VFSVDVDDTVLEITIPTEPTVINLTPTASGASFGSASLTAKVATNNITGYTLSMSAPDSNLTRTGLVGDEIEYRVIPTLGTGSFTEQTFTTNAWGYSLNSTSYYGLNDLVAPDAWTSDGPTNGEFHTLTLAAKVDASVISGSYETTLNFLAVTNNTGPRDTVVFNGNGADDGSMTAQVIYQGETANLRPNAYTKTGFLFNGWNTNADGTGVGYGNEDKYTSKATNLSINVNLYAQWIEDTGGGISAGRSLQAAYEQAYVYNTGSYWDSSRNTYKHGLYVPVKDDVTGEYTGEYFEATTESDYEGIPAKDLRFAIQDISMLVDGKNVCERATVVGSEAYVLDLRDNKSYWVAKMVDGKCWMTQNLDLDLTNGHKLTHSNTDLGWTNFDANAEWNPANTTIPFDIEGYIDRWTGNYIQSDVVPSSTDPGDSYVVTSGNDDSDTLYKSKQACIAGTTSTSEFCAHYHVGNYYNWTAAIAENDSSTAALTTAWGTAPNSICPAGWRLPLGNRSADISDPQNRSEQLQLLIDGNIIDDYNRQWFKSNSSFNAVRTAPFYMVRAGKFEMMNQYQVKDVGLLTTANYWGNSIDTYSYGGNRLTFTKSYIYVSIDSKYSGMSVRCVAR
jgi:uncharacterized protein (TIGR02145 family)